jgi:acetolactate synthase-1/2/3 large subunit
LVVPFPPHEPAVAELIAAADVVLVLGSDLDAMMTRQFSVPMTNQLIQVDVREEHIGTRYPVAVPVVGDVREVVPRLINVVGDIGAGAQERGTTRAKSARHAVFADLRQEPAFASSLGLLDAIDRALPPDGVVVCDMAIAGYWAAGLLNLAPRRQLIYPIGWGTLGFGLPAAIGAAVAAPQTRTLCIAGDAGLAYALGELATLIQEQLPVTVVVVNDGGYGMLRYAASLRFGREFATDVSAPDFAALARSFGLTAWDAALDSPDVADVLGAALAADGPNLVHLRGSMAPPRMALLGTPHKRQSTPPQPRSAAV